MSKTYTTIQGDMWDSIAHKLLGSALYADRLMNSNISHIYTYIFPAGVVLTIPDIKTEEVATLPPWKG